MMNFIKSPVLKETLVLQLRGYHKFLFFSARENILTDFLTVSRLIWFANFTSLVTLQLDLVMHKQYMYIVGKYRIYLYELLETGKEVCLYGLYVNLYIGNK